MPLKHGATLVLIGEALGKDPIKLAQVIAAERISDLVFDAVDPEPARQLRQAPERHDYSALRMVFFAGEVFPIPQFRALRALWPAPRYFNLYGPTETNVCTWYEVPVGRVVAAMPTFPDRHDLSAESRQGRRRAGRDGAVGSEGELRRARSERHARLLEPARAAMRARF